MTIILVLAVTGIVMSALLSISVITTSQIGQTRDMSESDQTFFAAEGGLQHALHRLIESPGPQTYTLTIQTATVEVSITVDPTDPLGKRRVITSTATVRDKTRSVRLVANSNSIAGNIQYAVQSGSGGIELANNSEVHGNLYANGPIVGQNQNAVTIFGETWSTTSISNLTIGTAAVPKDSHAPVYANVVVHGSRITETPPSTSYPFTQQQTDEFKNLAEAMIVNGSVTISNDTTFSARKIVGNLTINSGTLTLEGPVWVTGTIDMKPGVTIRLPASAGEASGVLMADDLVNVENLAQLMGSGNPKSFLMIISFKAYDQNNPAIFGSNNSQSVIYFAPDGLLRVKNNAELNNTTGYRIHLLPNAVVRYNSNLSGFSIPAGPPTPITPQPGTWLEL